MERLKSASHQARALEWALVLLFVLVLSWVVLNRYGELKATTLHTIARYEHQLLQTRVQIYRIRHGSWPPTLRDALGGDPREVLMAGPNPERQRLVNEDGRLIDPFGVPYRYHPDNGRLERPEGLSP